MLSHVVESAPYVLGGDVRSHHGPLHQPPVVLYSVCACLSALLGLLLSACSSLLILCRLSCIPCPCYTLPSLVPGCTCDLPPHTSPFPPPPRLLGTILTETVHTKRKRIFFHTNARIHTHTHTHTHTLLGLPARGCRRSIWRVGRLCIVVPFTPS
jgi:hypothetical protein